METKENIIAANVKTKKIWDKPEIMELDFSETRQQKSPKGGDGDPPQFGNLKTGS